MSSILKRKTLGEDTISEETGSSSSIAHLIRDFNSKGKSPVTSAANQLLRTKSIRVLNRGVTFKDSPRKIANSSEPFTKSLALRRSATMADFAKKTAITDFIIGKEIGKGDFSVVRQAVNRYSKTTVAVKIYEKISRQTTSKVCLNEKEALEKLRHSNIVFLMEFVDTPKKSYLVLEYLEGTSLKSFVKSKKLIPELECISLFKGIINALDFCHSTDIAHMHVCPDNVLIDTSDTPKIIDFGASVNASRAVNGNFRVKSKHPAPELISHKQIIPKHVDVWDAGVLLFFMLTGTYPFSAHNDFELEHNICNGVINFPSHVSDEAKDLIRRMLDVCPDSRFTTEQVMDDPWFQKLNQL